MADLTPTDPTSGTVPLRCVACPTCGAQTPFHAGNPWRPFCGARCRSVDLGAWASERYRLPADAAPAGDPSAPAH